MGCLAFFVLFFVVDGIFTALIGQPWGLVIALLCGVVLPAVFLAIAAAHDRDAQRELDRLVRPPDPAAIERFKQIQRERGLLPPSLDDRKEGHHG